MNLKGQISISRYMNSREMERPISIRVTDETSRIEFLEINLSLEEFALVMTGLSGVNCELETRGLNFVGMKREVKEEWIAVPEKFSLMKESNKKELAKELITPFEVEGWMGRPDDMLNHYNFNYDEKKYKVTFTRYVKGESNEGM